MSMKKSIIILSTAVVLAMLTGFSSVNGATDKKETTTTAEAFVNADTTKTATPVVKPEGPLLTLYKKSALATYYADKFNGRKTSSGERFKNSSYTAAHMKLPMGTMLRVTNESNGKFVDVKVNDRGPFSKKLEIDLTKKAFMDIASNKSTGSFKVKIEIIEKV